MAIKRQTLEARAQARAIEQDVRILPLAGTDGREFLAQSIYSEPGAYWQLLLDSNDQPHCNCPGFISRQSCKHVEALKMHLYEVRMAAEATRKKRDIAALKQLFEEAW